MTTALIGLPGATTAKASVAIVASTLSRELASLLEGTEHDFESFGNWEEFRLARAEGRTYDIALYDFAETEQLPDEIGCPAMPVSDQGPGMTLATLSQAMSPLAAIAAELRAQSRRRQELERIVDGLKNGEPLAGQCPVTRRVQSGISRAADSDATVLIEGAPGTGKSLAARMIHCKSRCSNRPLQVAECSELDAGSMAELLSTASGSTLVLENVDALPAPAQSVLVKHLKERTGPRGQGCARLVATTSAHLPEAIARGTFREDLYYRLHAFPLVMPALRERLEDIRAIADTVLQLASAQSGRPAAGISPAALAVLESMPWPGNVTQLEAVLRRAHTLAGGTEIGQEHVAASNPATQAPAGAAAAAPAPERDPDREIGEDEIRTFEEEEQYLLSRALRATKGNVRRAAQLLGIGRATLYRKIQQYKLRLQ